MSTIKSSNEHLTLNADGSGKSVKFQANGVEKASISSAGAFTSTTIDATKLTGALPAISGAALTGVGVAGITSTADATAITIDSNEQVGIGVSSLAAPLQIRKRLSSVGQSTPETVLLLETDAGSGDMSVGNGTRILFKIADDETNPSVGASIDAVRANGDDSISSTDLVFSTSQNDETLDEALRITNDGRGLSQFTAKAWLAYNGNNNTVSDSHNISSVTDNSAGNYTMNFSNNMANTTYVSTGCAPNNNDTTDGSFIMAITNNVGSCKIIAHKHNGTNNDRDKVQVITFGD